MVNWKELVDRLEFDGKKWSLKEIQIEKVTIKNLKKLNALE